MSLKWAINGFLDDMYFMAQGLPRVLFTWKPENELSILNFFEKNVKRYPNEIAFVFKEQEITWQEADLKGISIWRLLAISRNSQRRLFCLVDG
jgi:hypothetical protein